MKKTLLSLLTVCVVGIGYAQSDIIAVTGSKSTKIDFQDFRFLDIEHDSEKIIAYNNAEIPEQVVGMTYDANNQKLIFVGMHSPAIYTYDLVTSQYERVYASGTAYARCALSEQFSRMTTASTGVSYALNNGSTQLIEIRPTQSGYAVTELGALKSDINLNQYKLYGGDLIADDQGNLYLISAYRKVVKINPTTQTASYVGELKGIDQQFTTNGSAVMANGEVLLSNAQGKGLYSLDFNNLEATRLENATSTAVYDLASPYLLRTSTDVNPTSMAAMQVYPSKVTNREVTISLNQPMKGMGAITVYDIAGNQLIQSKMDLSQNQNIKKLTLNTLRPGNYYVKVVDQQGIVLLNEKIIVLR